MSTDISTIKPEELQDPALFEQVQAAVLAAQQDGFYDKMMSFRIKLKEFFRVYSEDIERDNPDLIKRYRNLLLYIELVNYELIPENDQLRLAQHNTQTFRKAGTSFDESIRAAAAQVEPVLRDEFLEVFTKALLENDEKVGGGSIQLKDREVRPTLGNWLMKFREQYGNEPQESFVQMDFLSRGEEARSLSEEDREAIAEVLKVYNDLLPKTIDDGSQEEEQPKKKEQAVSSPFATPAKKPIVPEDEVRKTVGVPGTSGAGISPDVHKLADGQEVIMDKAEEPEKPQEKEDQLQKRVVASGSMQSQKESMKYRKAPVFTSLGDLKSLDLETLHATQVSTEDFIARVKSEIEKVKERSPESVSHIEDLWRQSPLYNLYMEMGQASMNQKKSVAEISSERRAAGQPALTKQEFDLIADLSKSIQ